MYYLQQTGRGYIVGKVGSRQLVLIYIYIATRMTISQLQELSCVEFVGFQGCSQKE